jgi:transcriptional regulator with XRE-family HTH domain
MTALQLSVWLSATRANKRWSTQDLADRSGVSRSTIALLEQGAGNTTVDTLYKLARAFEMRLSTLCRQV